jgi:hypothetical protein
MVLELKEDAEIFVASINSFLPKTKKSSINSLPSDIEF